MTTCQYYTPSVLADFLVSKIPVRNAKRILDLCAGSGNLLAAAREKWPSAFIVGVDIDPNAIAHCNERFSKPALFLQGDARLLYPGIPSNNCSEVGTNDFDVVLANPPFIRNGKSIQFPPPELGSQGATIDWTTICHRIEAQLLVHNMLYVRDGGYLVAIIPNGILSCDRFVSLRKWIIAQSESLKVIRLPEKIFHKSEVSASALIVRRKPKNKLSEPVRFILQVARLRADALASKTIYNGEVSSTSNNARLDVACRFPGSTGPCSNLKEFASIIKRGSFVPKSSLGKTGTYHYIHSTNIRDSGLDLHTTSSYVTDERVIKTGVHTRQGDILIVRVGKTLGKIGVVTDSGQPALISSCLFLVRPKGIDSYSLALLLQCQISQEHYCAVARGSAAGFLTYADIRETPIPLLSSSSLVESAKEYEATLRSPFQLATDERIRAKRITQIVSRINSVVNDERDILANVNPTTA